MRLFYVLLVLALAGPRRASSLPRRGTQSTLAADRPTALAPNTTYDPKIPTLKAVLGYDTGERITPPEGSDGYLKALHAAAPERTRALEYARTWERRPLSVLIVASPERIARPRRDRSATCSGSPIRAAWRRPTPTRSWRARRSSRG